MEDTITSVLVTGGLGVIGSLVTRRLVEAGYVPVVYEVNIEETARVRDILGSIVLCEGDVRDYEHLQKVMREHSVRHVVHTAAIVGPVRSHEDLRRTVEVNIDGTVAVIESALSSDVKRFIYFSTKGVYDYIGGKYGHPSYEPVNEDYPKMSPPSNHSLYDATKQFCEHLLTKYNEKHGLDFAAFRFGSTWSPGKHTLSSLPHMIDNAMCGIPTTIPKGGDQKEDFTYSKNIANAVVLALESPKLTHKFYQIATGEVHTLGDAAAVVREFYPDAEIRIGPGLDYHGFNSQTYAQWDISRAREDLGYYPSFTFRQAIADYIRTTLDLELLPGARSPVASV